MNGDDGMGMMCQLQAKPWQCSSRAYSVARLQSVAVKRKSVVLNVSMNVTQLQQPPPQPSPPRSASEAEDITPDVCGLPMAWNCYTQTPITVLVDKTRQQTHTCQALARTP